MIERELLVANRLGLHARASARLVQVLSGFRCNATLIAKGREVNAKSIMGVMLLAAGPGTTVLLRVDGGAGVLVLTDLYGATPSNLAAKVAQLGTSVRRVSAVNLPMLLRIMNYAELDLDELPAVAAAGARNGVIQDDA